MRHPDLHLFEPDAHLLYPDSHLLVPDPDLREPDPYLLVLILTSVKPDPHVRDPDPHVHDPDPHLLDPDAHLRAPVTGAATLAPGSVLCPLTVLCKRQRDVTKWISGIFF